MAGFSTRFFPISVKNGTGGSGAPYTTTSMVKNIPADFPTMAAAVADYLSRVYLDGAQYEIQITAGHIINEQIILDGISAINLHITALGTGCTINMAGLPATPLGFPAFIFCQDSTLGEITGTFVGANSASSSFLQGVRADTRSGSLTTPCSVTGFYIPFFSAGSHHASLTTTVNGVAAGYSANYNSTLVIASGVTNSLVQCVGSTVEIEGGSVNGSAAPLGYAIVSTGGGRVSLNSPNVTGVIAASGGVVSGAINVHTENPAGQTVMVSSSVCGEIDVATNAVSLIAGSAANYANAVTASKISANVSAVVGTSTGLYAGITNASQVSVAGVTVAFTGGPSQALYIPTANGLIIA